MKLKKLLAFGASLVLVSSCAVLPVSADSKGIYVVVSRVDTKNGADNGYYVVAPHREGYLDRSKMEYYTPSIGEIQQGDIIFCEGCRWDSTEEEIDGAYTYDYFSIVIANSEIKPDYSVVGSVLDNPETDTFKVEDFSIEENDRAFHRIRCNLVSESDKTKSHYFDFNLENRDISIEHVDWASLQNGDTVSCITYNGFPVFVTEKVSDITVKPVSAITANGDADGNGALDILDIITVNKAILGKENLDAERIPYIDFNQNNVPDSDDALTMLKMIVGLA